MGYYGFNFFKSICLVLGERVGLKLKVVEKFYIDGIFIKFVVIILWNI